MLHMSNETPALPVPGQCPCCGGKSEFKRYRVGQDFVVKIACTVCGVSTKEVFFEVPPTNSSPVYAELAKTWALRVPARTATVGA